jgi:hypothetical protein
MVREYGHYQKDNKCSSCADQRRKKSFLPQQEDMGIIKAGGNFLGARSKQERALKMLW